MLLAPKPDHMVRINDWVEALPDESRLLIHCIAGVGRSPAVALGLLAKNHSPDAAMQILLDIRPEAVPNILIVTYWDELLQLNGKLANVLSKNLPID